MYCLVQNRYTMTKYGNSHENSENFIESRRNLITINIGDK